MSLQANQKASLFTESKSTMDRLVLKFFWSAELIGLALVTITYVGITPFNPPSMYLLLSSLLIPSLLTMACRFSTFNLRYPITIGMAVTTLIFHYATGIPEMFHIVYLFLLGVSLYRDRNLYIFNCVLISMFLLLVTAFNPSNTGLPLNYSLIDWFIFLIYAFTLYSIINTIIGKERALLLHAYEDTVQAFTKAIEAKDNYTKGHTERTTEYVMVIAQEMVADNLLTESDLEKLHVASILHDIGKIGIPDIILLKPKELEQDEYEYIKSHTSQGIRILEKVSALKDILPAIQHHHERYDGSGYPDGLSGEAIPVWARIIAVADAFDAMTTDRLYRKALDVEVARQQIMANQGTQFDPLVVNYFNRVFPQLVEARVKMVLPN
ncbi:MAG: HD-GYP domain-containing protein [Thermincolia bacterium]